MTDRPQKPLDEAVSAEVPDLDLPVSRTTAAAAKSSVSAAPVASYSGEIDPDDDDMVVDRNIVPPSISVSSSRIQPAVRPLSSGLELGAPMVGEQRLSVRSHDKVRPKRFDVGVIVNVFVVAVGGGGAGVALSCFMHRARGWDATSPMRPALDGGSALFSGALSLGTLAVCITLAIMAMYARPRSLGYLVASVGMLVVAIAAMTITFSVGPDGAPEIPPNGAALVPWALPVAPLGVALRLTRNAYDRCAEGEGLSRFIGCLLAACAGAVAFVAAELLFGAGLRLP